MLAKFSIIRSVALIILAMGLTGCGGKTLSGLASVKPPTNEDITAEYNAFVLKWDAIADKEQRTRNDPYVAQLYVTHGYDLAERSCLLYFAKLKQLRNETTFASDTMISVFAAGGVVAGLSGVAAPILAGIFAGGGMVPNLIHSFNDVYLLAEVGDDLYPTIVKTMAGFRADHPADGPTPKVSKWTAAQLVQQHASLCSLPAMTSIVNAGVASLQLTLDKNTGVVSAAKAPPAKK